jgi:polysaccharide export outer membrane protein
MSDTYALSRNALFRKAPFRTALRVLDALRGLPAVVAAVSVALLCLGSIEPVRAQDQATSGYKLGSGDRIRVIVFGHEDLSGEFDVDGSGNVSLPLIRTVDAAGLTVAELEEKIENELKPDYLLNPRISVEVLNYRPFYIYGEVNQPGSYPYVSGMTVINAVAMAGGYTYRARESSVRITRANDEQADTKTVDPGTPVLPGDVIEVPERFF